MSNSLKLQSRSENLYPHELLDQQKIIQQSEYYVLKHSLENDIIDLENKKIELDNSLKYLNNMKKIKNN